MEKYDSNRLNLSAFDHIDAYTDSFALLRGVASDLLLGDSLTKSEPWLSVVIPTYRRSELLREALESVLRQSPPGCEWELLVVDNTPLDEAGETPALRLIRTLDDPRVLYYHNRENIGPGYNWNRGVELARGEWIVFLHDDDMLLPNALANIGRQLRAYRGKKPLGYLHARRVEFNGGRTVDQAVEARRYPPERLTRFGVLLSGGTGAGAPTCGTVIRKSAYMETGGINYDFGPSADAVLCYQLMRRYAVVLSDRVLGGYRWGDNESIKKEALVQMIRADEHLSSYAYTLSPFARLWGGLFGAASSWRNIRQKNKIAQRYKVDITKNEFSEATAYPEPSGMKKMAFLGFYALYRLIRRGLGWFHAV